MISYALGTFLTFYNLLILIRVLLSWFPSINWYLQPYNWLAKSTDPVLNIFRGIIPPIGGMLDISPVLAILLLQLVGSLVIGLLNNLGL